MADVAAQTMSEAHPLGRGLDILADHTAIDRGGTPVAGLYVPGPPGEADAKALVGKGACNRGAHVLVRLHSQKAHHSQWRHY